MSSKNHISTKGVSGMKKWGKRFTLLVLMLTLVLGSAMSAFAAGKDQGGKGRGEDGKVRVTFEFEDMAQAEWAIQYMTSMQIKGVITGYPDGKFQPNKPINQIEAITTAVRILGLEEEAQAKMDTKLSFKDANQIENKYPWAVGYIAVALEQGLFDSDDDKVQAEKPASRVWTAALLVKALGKKEEAQAKMNTQLTFKDRNAIPAGSVGYVAVAVENKLVEGYENNTFRPNKPVTRAEMAALLDRLDVQLENDLDESEWKGTFVSSTDTSITLQTDNMASMTLPLAEQVYVFIDRKQVTTASLVIGDDLTVRTVDGEVVFISAKVQKEEFEGIVFSLTPMVVTNEVYGSTILTVLGDDDHNVTRDFIVNADTKVTYDGKTVAWTEILVGDEVEVNVVRNQVIEVEIEKRKEVEYEGVTLKQFTLDASGQIISITVTDEAGKDWTFAVAKDADIKLKGAVQLKVGDVLEIKAEGNQVTEIEVEND
jgi:hypothetical protein